MRSALAWLDRSESQRRRMLEIIDLFRDRTTVDDLGIGTVRDAFADLLFPGTSTLHTRVRYFLFIPWIYLDLERRRVPSSRVAKLAREHEVRLSNALLSGGEGEGVIGREAGARLKRLPSVQYWGGLARWGVRLYPGSQDRYHSSLDGFYRSTKREARDDGERTRLATNWHPGIPPRPDRLLDEATFALSPVEADYLRERIVMDAGRSLLAHLVTLDETTSIDDAWQHPSLGGFPAEMVGCLEHARNFSEVIHVAGALYNLMLAQASSNDELVDEYMDLYERCRAKVEGRLGELRDWDRHRFWATVALANASIPSGTRSFIDTFLDLATTDAPDLDAIRSLLSLRERAMKGRRARLTNRDALERWGGASSTAQLDFRWRIAQSLVNDIVDGLNSDDA